MFKPMLTKEQMIKDLSEMHPAMGEWTRSCLHDSNMTVQETLDAMQRIVKYIQEK
jgi:hypothetical protein